MSPGLISVEEAVERLLLGVESIAETENLPLAEALGRVLTEDQVSRLRVPPANNSAMDGYALGFADIVAGKRRFPVSQRIPAGWQSRPLVKGSAARVFTGAELPDGADVVVMQEDCEETSGEVVIQQPPSAAGEHVRRAGQDIEVGAVVANGGTRLGPAQMGLLASVGLATVQVRRRLRVSVLSTGDELVRVGEPLHRGQIHASNQFLLGAMLKQAGYQVIDGGIVPDDLPSTCSALDSAAAAADCLISMGGVSVGEEDHVREAVDSLGAITLWKVNIKPGKPFAFGRVGETPFLGLPGNPVSVFVTFLLLVRPYLARLQGMTYQPLLRLQAKADFDWPRAGSRQEFLRGQFRGNAGAVKIFDNQSSGVLSSVSWADCLVEIPARTTVARGDLVDVLLLE